jgi:hypothetical protein
MNYKKMQIRVDFHREDAKGAKVRLIVFLRVLGVFAVEILSSLFFHNS